MYFRILENVKTSSKWGLLAAGAFAAALIAEGGLRLAGALLRRGPADGPAGERVLCIGESTTWNQYTLYLAQALDSPARRFTVIDEGVPGTNSGIILGRLDGLLDRHAPHVVVAMVGANDSGWSVPLPADAGWGERLRAFAAGLRTVKLVRLARGPRAARAPAEESPADVMAARGSLHAERLEWDAAEKYFRKAAELDPGSPFRLVRLASMYEAAGRPEQAAQAYHAVLERDPLHRRALWRLTKLLQQAGRPGEAEARLKKALERSPNYPPARIGLESLAAARGERPALDEMTAEALSGGGDWSANDLVDLGNLHLPDWDKAELLWKRALRADPDSREIQNLLALSRQRRLSPGKKIGPPRSGGLPGRPDNLKNIRDKVLGRGIRFVAVQYPTLPVGPLRELLGDGPGIRCVDNEASFKEGVAREGYRAYFVDEFGGGWGHCTAKGKRLLAENIAAAIRSFYSESGPSQRFFTE